MRLFTNKRGSAIIMALVTITILLVLGMAVITLSMGTLTTNVADATTNDTYYAAEAGINSAIEQVKAEVVKYYAEMSKLDGNYTSLYDNFFAGIALRSQGSFDEPDIQNMSTIHTTFSAGNINADDNTGDILISCEATATDGTKYAVNGSVKVLRIDLRSSGEWFFDGIPLYAGGTLHVNHNYSGVTPNNATIICNKYTPNSWTKNGGGVNYNVTVDTNAAAAIGDPIPYPSYSNPNLDSNVKILPSGSYLANVNAISQGIIYCQGNLTINAWAPVYKDIYCDGILTISGTEFYGNIYCRDIVEFSGGSFSGNIICDGIVKISSCNRTGFIMAGESIEVRWGSDYNCSYYAVGPINITGAGGSYGVVYSATQLNLGDFSGKGIFFSGGDVFLNGSPGMTALVAKGTVHINGKNLAISYDQSYIDSVKANNPFFFPSSGSGVGSSNTPTSDVIQGQTVTAVGRIN